MEHDNTDFWDELCGTAMAKKLGVVDDSSESLAKYDKWYFGLYPYLKGYITPYLNQRDLKVLEVGLGFGTLSEWMGSQGTHVTGLDIASGPVKMFNSRFQQKKLRGIGVQGSILAPPLHRDAFDLVIAIGSLHHTGDLNKAISECHGLLREGGHLVFMVYNAYSYRRWLWSFTKTLRHWLWEKKGGTGALSAESPRERGMYDTNTQGDAAPHTDFLSKESIKTLTRNFSHVSISLENVGARFPFNLIRPILLVSPIAKFLGLDIYVQATK